jgi:hypothetical protein
MTALDDLLTGHESSDTHLPLFGQHLLPDGQSARDTQNMCAVGDLSLTGHAGVDTQAALAGQHLLPDGHERHDAQTTTAVGDTSHNIDGWLELRTWAELYFDTQDARKAANNKARATGAADIFAGYTANLEQLELDCKKAMLDCYKRVVPAPIIAWQQSTPGIGEHLLARLLGHLGHPVVARPHHWEGTGAKRVLVADTPYERTVSQLWQYCGHGDPTRRIKAGMSAEELAAVGSPRLKMITHLLAEACMKAIGGETSNGVMRKRSPYRDVYDLRRIETIDRLHAAPCVRCGPKGKPAPEGSPWSLAHQNADALRIVGKELLRDLWRVSQ